MKLVACLDRIDDMRQWDVRFYEDQPLVKPQMHTITDKLDVLYREWFKAGPGRSGDVKGIFGVMFSNREDGRTFLVDDCEVMTFEDLMHAVGKKFDEFFPAEQS